MPHLLPASRRAVVGVGAVTLAPVVGISLAACEVPDAGRLLPADDPTGSRGAADVAPDAAPDADEAVVDEAVAELAEVLGVVAAARVRHPPLRLVLADLQAVHVAHLAALEGDQRGPAAPPTADAAAALALVRRREVAHQRRLTDLSVRAGSGQLAQLLASMAAGVAQHVVVLPRRPGAGA